MQRSHFTAARTRTLRILVGAAFGVLSAQQFAHGDSSWTFNGNGNWNTPSNWLGGVPNGPGVSATFGNISSGKLTVDLPAPFTIGSLIINSSNGFLLDSTTVDRLTFNSGAAGTNARITNSGGFGATVAAGIQLNSDLDVFNGQQTGLTFTGSLFGTGAINVYGNASRVFFTGTPPSAWSGGMHVKGGVVTVSNTNALGSGSISIDGRSDAQWIFNVSGQTVNNDIYLNNRASGYQYNGAFAAAADMTMAGTLHLGDRAYFGPNANRTMRLRGAVVGGDLVKVNGGTIQINTASSTYTGATIVSSGVFSVIDAGALTTTSGVVVHAQGEFALDNRGANNLPNRLPDSVPIDLRGGKMALYGAAAANTTEHLGTVSLTGGESSIVVTGGTDSSINTALTIGTLSRSPGAVLIASGLGTSAAPLGSLNAGAPRLFLDNPPTLQNGIVGGWAAMLHGGLGPDFATYDASRGLYHLPTTGRPSQLNGALPVDNVRCTSAVAAATSDITINSLWSNQSINLANHTLKLNTGALLMWPTSSSSAIFNGTLTSGGPELVVRNFSAGTQVTISTNIVDGPGPMDVTIAGGFQFAGVNTYSGRTYVNAGSLSIPGAASFPDRGNLTLSSNSIFDTFTGNTPVRLGEVVLNQNSWLGPVNVTTTRAPVDVTSIEAHTGNIALALSGNGTVNKTTDGSLFITVPTRNFSGNFNVYDGLMWLRQTSADALGSGLTTVNYPARFVCDTNPSLNAGISLAGGELIATGTQTTTFNGAFDVLASANESRVMTDDQQDTKSRALVFTGATTIAAGGALRVDGLGTVTFPAVANNGALFIDNRKTTTGFVTGNSGLIQVGATSALVTRSMQQSLVRVVGGGSISVIADGTDAGASRIGTLDLAAHTATLDLSNNDLLIKGGTSKSSVEASVRDAYNFGGWDQPGLTSSTAKNGAGNTTLGVMSGQEYLDNNGAGTFDGFAVDPSDVLVKYTYYGDVDFNGAIDASDYNLIDFGFVNHLTGWANGDADYSGSVDVSDYNLIDFAFSSQNGTVLRAIQYLDGTDRSTRGMDDESLQVVMSHFQQFGDGYASGFLAAVPEPTSLTGAAIACGAMLRRRRRRC